MDIPAPTDDAELRLKLSMGAHIVRWNGSGRALPFKQRPDLTFAEVDPMLETWTGIPVSDWREKQGLFLESIEEGERLAASLQATTPIHRVTFNTFRFRHIGTGRITRVSEERAAEWDANGRVTGYEGLWQDITQDYAADERRLLSAWRESLSSLMVTSLHDFCNIATALVGLAQSLEASSDLENLRSSLSSVRAAAFGASQVAHRLQRWHARVHGEKTFVDLNDAVRNMSEILRKVLPRRIRVETELAEAQLPIEVDALGLDRAMVVFAMNAADAMPAGGLVKLSTCAWETAPKLRNVYGKLPKPPLISLSVTDAGLGMPASALKSISAPFFTTKPLGKGAGRGLYGVLLFAEKYGAALSIDTEKGKGTAVHLWFARANLDAVQPAEPLARLSLLVTGRDPGACNELAEYLRESGFYAESMCLGMEPLELLCSPHYEFDAVLVRMEAANESTLAFCREARERNPRVRILIATESHEPEAPSSTTTTMDGWTVLTLGAPHFIEQLKTALESN